MTTARDGSTPSSFAAVKNVSGAGFPAKCCAWIVLPSTCDLEEGVQLGGLEDGPAVLTRGDDGNFEPLTPELMDEAERCPRKASPHVFDYLVDQVVLAVPEPAHRLRLCRVVRASLGELDVA